VPKEASIQLQAPLPAQTRHEGSPTDRMLAATVVQGQQVWFFKATGPVARLDDAVARRFREFLMTVHFNSSGEPEWELPSGWSTGAPAAARFATLLVGDNVEVTVIALPAPAGAFDPYLLMNVNRWRGQLSLSPLRALADSLETIGLPGGQTAHFVDLQGWQSTAAPPMQGPFAGADKGAGVGGGGLPPDHPPLSPRATDAADRDLAGRGQPAGRSAGAVTTAGLQYDIPSGWQPGGGGAMRAASFKVVDAGREVEITVIPLATGDLLDNVNRWRDQAGLQAVKSESEIEAETLAVGAHSGRYVQLHNAAKNISILAVIVPAQGRFWFVKLSGDTGLAKREEPHFRQFVTSLKIP